MPKVSKLKDIKEFEAEPKIEEPKKEALTHETPEYVEIKLGENYIKVKKSEDDIKLVISVLTGMHQGYFGEKSKKLWK
jgi:hypothetical protein